MKSLQAPAHAASLEARVGTRLAGLLTSQSQALPHDVTERLRFAREQALARAKQSRVQSAPESVALGNGVGTMAMGGFASWWQRAASLLPLLVLVSGLVMIDQWVVHEQVLDAAEIDAQLLSDDLPPTAYSDPGFVEYLRSAPNP
jgi:Protein of unknown function (DUF3619)